MSLNSKVSFKKACSAVALLLPALASAESIYSLEYLPAKGNTEAAIGIGIYGTGEEGLGFYFNAQTAAAERKPHYDSLTVGSFGDPVRRRYRELAMVNIGVVMRFSPLLAVFAGGGYGAAVGKAEKQDPDLILDPHGTYFVDDPTRDETGGNLNAGVMFSFGSTSVLLGYHSFAKTSTVGVGFRF